MEFLITSQQARDCSPRRAGNDVWLMANSTRREPNGATRKSRMIFYAKEVRESVSSLALTNRKSAGVGPVRPNTSGASHILVFTKLSLSAQSDVAFEVEYIADDVCNYV